MEFGFSNTVAAYFGVPRDKLEACTLGPLESAYVFEHRQRQIGASLFSYHPAWQ